MHLSYLLPLLLCSLTPIATAQTYKWIDENGVVSYSQTPPASEEAQKLSIKAPSSNNSATANDELKRLRQRLEDLREDRQLATESAEKEQQVSEKKKSNCEAARKNLQSLQTSGNRLMKTADGSYMRLIESEREKRIQEAKDQVKAYCF